MATWGYGEAALISHLSHLSHAARGIDRDPMINEGPASRKMAARGGAPAAKDPWKRNDAGHTRGMANNLIRKIKRLKEESSNDDRGMD